MHIAHLLKAAIYWSFLDFLRSLTAHIRIHNNDKLYQCQECGKSFSDKTNSYYIIKYILVINRASAKNVRSHFLPTGTSQHTIIEYTQEINLTIKCQECGKSFTERRTLNSHNQIHTGEKPFECHVCGKSYIGRDSLITHKRSHTGESLLNAAYVDTHLLASGV